MVSDRILRTKTTGSTDESTARGGANLVPTDCRNEGRQRDRQPQGTVHERDLSVSRRQHAAKGNKLLLFKQKSCLVDVTDQVPFTNKASLLRP